MLDAILKLIGDSVPGTPGTHSKVQVNDVRVAACALLVELACADGEFSAAEQARTSWSSRSGDQRMRRAADEEVDGGYQALSHRRQHLVFSHERTGAQMRERVGAPSRHPSPCFDSGWAVRLSRLSSYLCLKF